MDLLVSPEVRRLRNEAEEKARPLLDAVRHEDNLLAWHLRSLVRNGKTTIEESMTPYQFVTNTMELRGFWSRRARNILPVLDIKQLQKEKCCTLFKDLFEEYIALFETNPNSENQREAIAGKVADLTFKYGFVGGYFTSELVEARGEWARHSGLWGKDRTNEPWPGYHAQKFAKVIGIDLERICRSGLFDALDELISRELDRHLGYGDEIGLDDFFKRVDREDIPGST